MDVKDVEELFNMFKTRIEDVDKQAAVRMQ